MFHKVDGLIEYTPKNTSVKTANVTTPELKFGPFVGSNNRSFTGLKGSATVTLKCILTYNNNFVYSYLIPQQLETNLWLQQHRLPTTLLQAFIGYLALSTQMERGMFLA